MSSRREFYVELATNLHGLPPDLAHRVVDHQLTAHRFEGVDRGANAIANIDREITDYKMAAMGEGEQVGISMRRGVVGGIRASSLSVEARSYGHRNRALVAVGTGPGADKVVEKAAYRIASRDPGMPPERKVVDSVPSYGVRRETNGDVTEQKVSILGRISSSLGFNRQMTVDNRAAQEKHRDQVAGEIITDVNQNWRYQAVQQGTRNGYQGRVVSDEGRSDHVQDRIVARQMEDSTERYGGDGGDRHGGGIGGFIDSMRDPGTHTDYLVVDIDAMRDFERYGPK